MPVVIINVPAVGMLVLVKWPAPFFSAALSVPCTTLTLRPMAGIFSVPRLPSA